MNHMQAQKKIREYLLSHFINFEQDFDNNVPRITMLFQGCDLAPNKVVEACIWFYAEEMEVRVYYAQVAADWCKEFCENIPCLMQLFNYINALTWLKASDGAGNRLYQPHYLHTPRLYITEDGCYDITLTSVINYDFYEITQLETEDYITAYCPELLSQLSPAIFGLLLGEINLEMAKFYIRDNLVDRKE